MSKHDTPSRHSVRLPHPNKAQRPHWAWLWWIVVIAALVAVVWAFTGCTDPQGQFTFYQPDPGAPPRTSIKDDCKLCSLLGTCGDANIMQARHKDWTWVGSTFGLKPATRPAEANAK